MIDTRLHGYFRSSAAWRVRIALNLKGLVAEQVVHHLRQGDQRAPEYLALNLQGLVPALETDDGAVLVQSLAICEWLEEGWPQPPLLPSTRDLRAGAGLCPGHRLRYPPRLEPEGTDAAAAAWPGGGRG